MSNFSLTITATAVWLIKTLLQSAGIAVPETEIQSFLNVAINIILAASIWYGRWRKGDISIIGQRR